MSFLAEDKDKTSSQEREEITGILDRGTRFEGKLSFEGIVKISGYFVGEIFTRNTLIINSGAFVKGEVEARTIILSGKVEGNLFAHEQVKMYPPAHFIGTVTSPNLSIEEGVRFEGASYLPEKKPSSPTVND